MYNIYMHLRPSAPKKRVHSRAGRLLTLRPALVKLKSRLIYPPPPFALIPCYKNPFFSTKLYPLAALISCNSVGENGN